MKKIFFSILLASLISLPASAGFSLGQTRVIYNESERQSTLRLINSSNDEYYLVQSWLNMNDNEHSQRSKDFIITPPVFKSLPNTENTLLIRAIKDDFLKDRESIYYLNVKAIPAVDSSIKNKITFATKSIIKLIYRPKALNSEDAANAWRKVEIRSSNGSVTFKNPTPYFINIGVLFINGESNKISYIAPFTTEILKTKDNKRATLVEYNVINDFGGASDLHKIKI